MVSIILEIVLKQRQRQTIIGLKMSALAAAVVGLATHWNPTVITLFDYEFALITTAAVIFFLWFVCYKIVM